MKHRDAPCRIREHISVQQVGTETLVYDERRHVAFCLNQSSTAIWQLADGKRTTAQIARAASVQLKSEIGEDLVSFAIHELRRDGLIQPASSAELRPSISRRALLQRLGTGGALLLPAVAAIVAPTAAQAYSGCVDCSDSQAARARKRQSAADPGK
jgi:hypothetical protein